MADFLSDADVGLGAPAAAPAAVLSDHDVGLAAHDGALSNSADDGYASGAAKGAATAVIKGAANIPGLYGNLRDTGQYLADRGIANGKTLPTDGYLPGAQAAHDFLQSHGLTFDSPGAPKAAGPTYDDVAKRQQEIDDKIHADRANDTGLGWLVGKMTDLTSPSHLFSGHDIAAPVLEKTGEYTPTSMPGRMAQSGLEAAVSALGPGSGAAAAPTASGGALSTLKAIGATGREMAPSMLAGGAAAQGTTELTGDPLLGMIAGAAVPAAGGKAWDAAAGSVKKLTAPMFKSQHERLADEQFHDLHTDPNKALADLSFQPHDLLPGAPSPTAQITADAGALKATEQAQITADAGALKATEQAQIHDNDFNARIKGMEAQQNLARRAAIDATQPTGDTMRPSDVLNQHLADLDASTQATVDRMTAGRDQLNGAIPDAVPAETSGAQLRGAVQEAGNQTRAARKAIFDAVDPENKLAIVSSSVRDAAEVIQKSVERDRDVTKPGEHAPDVLQMAANLPDVVPFRKLIALDQTISGAMSAAKRASDFTGADQLRALKGAVKDAISRAVDNQHYYEQSQAAAGQHAGPVLEQRLQSKIDEQRAGIAGENAATGTGEVSAARAPVDPAAAGDVGNSGAGLGNSGRNPSAPGASASSTPAPNIDPLAAGRIADANAAHADYAQTYRNGPVGRLLKTNGYEGQYLTRDSSVPGQSFVKGDKGYETAQTMLGAAKNAPEAVSAIQDMAVTRLQEAMKDGPLTEATLAKWKADHAGALRAVDEVSPGFSKQFDNAAKATTLVEQAGAARAAALKEAQTGAAGKIMGAASGDEVRARVGKMLDSAEGGASNVADLVQRVGHDPAALEGLRRAGVEHVMSKFSNMGTSGGEPIISGKMSAYLETHGDALTALFGEEGMANMRRTAASLDRDLVAKEALATTNSATANKMSWLKGALEKGGHISLGTIMLMEGGEALMSGQIGKAVGVAGLAAAKHLFSTMRAKGLNSVNDLVKERLANPEVGRAALARAINAKSGKLRPSALNGLASAIARANATGNSLQQPDDAPPLTIHRYAEGGPVQADPDFMKHIIDAVAERVRASNPRGGGLAALR